MTRQVLRSVMVAVAFAASSLNGYTACAEEFDAHDGPVAVHANHDAHDTAEVHVSDTATHDLDEHRSGDADDCAHPCVHMHAHCCASTAVPAGDYGLKLSPFVSALPPDAGTPVPPGKLSYPLLRPPRSLA